jgi:hypothetical protein
LYAEDEKEGQMPEKPSSMKQQSSSRFLLAGLCVAPFVIAPLTGLEDSITQLIFFVFFLVIELLGGRVFNRPILRLSTPDLIAGSLNTFAIACVALLANAASHGLSVAPAGGSREAAFAATLLEFAATFLSIWAAVRVAVLVRPALGAQLAASDADPAAHEQRPPSRNRQPSPESDSRATITRNIAGSGGPTLVTVIGGLGIQSAFAAAPYLYALWLGLSEATLMAACFAGGCLLSCRSGLESSAVVSIPDPHRWPIAAIQNLSAALFCISSLHWGSDVREHLSAPDEVKWLLEAWSLAAVLITFWVGMRCADLAMITYASMRRQ